MTKHTPTTKLSAKLAGMSKAHPNHDRALASHPADWRRDHWRALYSAHPEWLDLETTCPHCGAEPFRPCHTPTYFQTRTHKARTNNEAEGK